METGIQKLTRLFSLLDGMGVSKDDMETGSQKLNRLFTLMDGVQGVSKEEHDASIKAILTLVVKMNDQIAKAISAIENTYSTHYANLHSAHAQGLNDIRGQVDHLFVKGKLDEMQQAHTAKMGEVDTKMQMVDEKIRKVKNGKDGAKGDMGLMGLSGRPGKDGVSPRFEDVVKEIKRQMARTAFSSGRILAGRPNPIWVDVSTKNGTLTGSVNGSNKVFNFSSVGVLPNSEHVYVDGMAMESSMDYTLTSKTLTLVVAPQTGETVRMKFCKM